MKRNILIIHCIMGLFFINGNIHSTYSQVQPLFTISDPEDGWDFNALDFSPNGNYIGTGTYKAATLWNADTGKKIKILGTSYAESNSLSFSPDGNKIAFGGAHLKASVWDINTNKMLQKYEGPFDPSGPIDYSAIAFSPDHRSIILGTQNGAVNLWDYETGKLQWLISLGTLIESLQYFPDGYRILINGYSIFSMYDGKIVKEFDDSGYGIIANNSIYNLSISGGSNEILKVINWNINTYEKISEYPTFQSESRIFKFSPNGKVLIIGKYENKPENTRILKPDTGLAVREFVTAKGEKPVINKIAFSPDSKRVALSSGNIVSVYDISDLTAGVKDAPEHK